MVVLNVLLSVILSGTVQAADWSSAADLITARKYHTATLLLNGRVLVVGGKGLTGTLASAELYDPATNKWSSAGNLSAARLFHSATLLPNGLVLVAGGMELTGTLATPLAGAELYNPATNKWTSAGNLSAARLFHSATLLPNGLVLVAGGEFIPGTLASAELYDPATNSWSSAGTMIDSRSSHSATLLSNGRVLVAGGIHEYGNSGSSYTLAGAELYDPATNSWSAADSLVTARYGQSATLLPDGRVLVAGGGQRISSYEGGRATSLASAELYDSETDTWSPTDSMSTTRGPSATLMPDGRVLVTGGYGAELYNPSTESWSPADNPAIVRHQHSATLLLDKRVLVAGGSNSTENQLASAELYGRPEPNSKAEFPWLILQPALNFNAFNLPLR
ncbi:MAG: hypothetical protein M8357_14810 [Desulfobulbaceae bacterium]|nr:hypothetical protein [Desulfobulbaceae bacterium]